MSVMATRSYFVPDREGKHEGGSRRHIRKYRGCGVGRKEGTWCCWSRSRCRMHRKSRRRRSESLLLSTDSTALVNTLTHWHQFRISNFFNLSTFPCPPLPHVSYPFHSISPSSLPFSYSPPFPFALSFLLPFRLPLLFLLIFLLLFSSFPSLSNSDSDSNLNSNSISPSHFIPSPPPSLSSSAPSHSSSLERNERPHRTGEGRREGKHPAVETGALMIR